MATEVKSLILQNRKLNWRKITTDEASQKNNCLKIYIYLKLMFILGSFSHKNKEILDAVLQLPDVKIVPPITKRHGIFNIKQNY